MAAPYSQPAIDTPLRLLPLLGANRIRQRLRYAILSERHAMPLRRLARYGVVVYAIRYYVIVINIDTNSHTRHE